MFPIPSWINFSIQILDSQSSRPHHNPLLLDTFLGQHEHMVFPASAAVPGCGTRTADKYRKTKYRVENVFVRIMDIQNGFVYWMRPTDRPTDRPSFQPMSLASWQPRTTAEQQQWPYCRLTSLSRLAPRTQLATIYCGSAVLSMGTHPSPVAVVYFTAKLCVVYSTVSNKLPSDHKSRRPLGASWHNFFCRAS